MHVLNVLNKAFCWAKVFRNILSKSKSIHGVYSGRKTRRGLQIFYFYDHSTWACIIGLHAPPLGIFETNFLGCV